MHTEAFSSANKISLYPIVSIQATRFKVKNKPPTVWLIISFNLSFLEHTFKPIIKIGFECMHKPISKMGVEPMHKPIRKMGFEPTHKPIRKMRFEHLLKPIKIGF